MLENCNGSRLSEFEALHIISDGNYARGVLLGGQNISTNRKEYRETVEAFKRASRKWKIRWSWVEPHTGNLGNQIADSLAKKGADRSNETNLEKDGRVEFCCWLSKTPNTTIEQEQAEKLFRTNPEADWNVKQQQKCISPPFCECNKSIVDEFKRNSKLTSEQQVCLVNKLQIGTHLEIFVPHGNNIGWHGGQIRSIEWIQYQPYPPGSKSEALQLGVHLILLYFIRISLLSAEIFFLSGRMTDEG